DEEELRARIDEARAERDTVGGVVEVRATGIPPGLGSYAAKEDRLDTRLAAAVVGGQAGKGGGSGGGPAPPGRRGPRGARAAAPPVAGTRTGPAGSRPASRTARRSSSARR